MNQVHPYGRSNWAQKDGAARTGWGECTNNTWVVLVWERGVLVIAFLFLFIITRLCEVVCIDFDLIFLGGIALRLGTILPPYRLVLQDFSRVPIEMNLDTIILSCLI